MKKSIVLLFVLSLFSCKRDDTPRCDNKYVQKSLIKNIENKVNSSLKSESNKVEIAKVSSTSVSDGISSCKADMIVTVKGINYTSGAVATIEGEDSSEE